MEKPNEIQTPSGNFAVVTKRSFLERVVGANWRTTISGIGVTICSALTVLSIIPYDKQITQIIPTQWQPIVFKVCFAAGALLKLYNYIHQKDNQVSGGRVTQDLSGNVEQKLVKL